MKTLDGAVWLPLIGAVLHPLLGWCVQEGTRKGARLTVTVAVANLLTCLIFFGYLNPEGSWVPAGRDWWAIGNGVIFFLGQWFSIQSVKSGDLAVHSSALGMKVVIVGVLSIMVGLEGGSWGVISGVILAGLAVFLVSGGSLNGWRRHRNTVGLTLVACLFFGLNDFLTGWKSREIGPDRWLVWMMGTSGLISLVLLTGRISQVKEVMQSRSLAGFVFGAGLLLGLQALAVNLAFSQYGKPTLSNVVYSSRGLMAVLFLYLVLKRGDRTLLREQVIGAGLMIAALTVVLVT